MALCIERIEGALALCENDGGGRVALAITALPAGAREGDVLTETAEGYALDRMETDRRRGAIADRLAKMSARARRANIERTLRHTTEPVSASSLAEQFRVSRQIVVGDIALLRASGAPVVATPRGYLLEEPENDSSRCHMIVCRHTTEEQLLEELYLAVDQGATVVDVTVGHPVYGQITGQLQIKSRYDADRFLQQLRAADAAPLSTLTGGIHLHTLRCPDQTCFERVCDALRTAGILVEDL